MLRGRVSAPASLCPAPSLPSWLRRKREGWMPAVVSDVRATSRMAARLGKLFRQSLSHALEAAVADVGGPHWAPFSRESTPVRVWARCA